MTVPERVSDPVKVAPPAADVSDVSGGFEALLDRVSEDIQRGVPVDFENLLEVHPEYAEPLQKLLPTMAAMAALGKSPTDHSAEKSVDGRKTLGDFQIRRQIGRGGMGVVYEAEQLSLGRKVALKVLPFAAVLDDKQIQRFKNEARAAGTLDHPHIVPVFSVGEERGVYYYAMAYIDGQSVADLIKELSQLRDGGISSLGECSRIQLSAVIAVDAENCAQQETLLAPVAKTTRSPAAAPARLASGTDGSTQQSTHNDPEYIQMAVRLGIQAAEALHHAHERGVIHRDVKPANLMLDARGQLHVTDFGLARLESDASMTMTGDLLGTIRYMSPEQALAKRIGIDHRTDIYSLGVTLYEILTLQPVFAGSDRQDLLRQIAFSEPEPPRQINPVIPRDLETILLKAIAKDPNDRYETAERLAEDLWRFQQDQPILARRPSLLERSARLVRKHQVLVAATSLITIIALGISTIVVSLKQKETNAALEKAEDEQRRAEENLALARDAVDQLYNELPATWYVDEPHLEDAHRAYLEKAVQFYEVLAQANDDTPELRFEIAKAWKNVGLIRRSLEQFDLSERALRRAFEEFEKLVQLEDPPPGCDRERAQTLWQLAAIQRVRRHFDEAHISFTKAIQALERLVAMHTADDELQYQLAFARNDFGLMLSMQGRIEEAERLYWQVLPLKQQLANAPPVRPRHLASLSYTYHDLAVVCRKTDRLDEAKLLLDKAVQLKEEVVHWEPDNWTHHWQLAFSYREQVALFDLMGRSKEALGAMREEVDVKLRMMREFPQISKYSRNLIDSVQRFANRLPDGNALLEANQTLAEAHAAITTTKGPGRVEESLQQTENEILDARMRLARLIRQSGQVEEAKRIFQESVDLFNEMKSSRPRGLLGPAGPKWVMQSYLGLAECLHDEGQHQPAVKTFRDGIAIVEHEFREGSSADYSDDLNSCAWQLSINSVKELRDTGTAVRFAQEAIRLKPNEPRYWNTLGAALYFNNDIDGALKSLTRSEELSHSEGVEAHNYVFLAMCYWRLGQKKDARAAYDHCAQVIHENAFEIDDLNRLMREAAELLELDQKTTSSAPAASQSTVEAANSGR